MANYTITIQEMMNSSLYHNIFPENYPFYVEDEQAKQEFEQKFIAYFYYREIGFETPSMFIQRLHTLMMLRMPYWKQLYETELEAKNINFLLNKDLLETFKREVASENELTGGNNSEQSTSITNTAESSQSSTATNNGTQSTTTENNHKESSLNDGVAQVSLTDGYLTGTSQDNGSQSTSTTDEATSSVSNEGTSSGTEATTLSSTNTQSENGKVTETTELVSKGNIGVTSSAQLLKEWREVLINMDEIIIKECNQLFIKLY